VVSTPQSNAVTFIREHTDAALRQRQRALATRRLRCRTRHVQGGSVRPRQRRILCDVCRCKPTTGSYPFPAAGEARPREGEITSRHGLPDGFSPTFSFTSSASTAEPFRPLVKEALAKIRHQGSIVINCPDAQCSTQINEKSWPFFNSSTEAWSAWLPAPRLFLSTSAFLYTAAALITAHQNSAADRPRQPGTRFEPRQCPKSHNTQEAQCHPFPRPNPPISLWQPNQDACWRPSIDGLHLPVSPPGR